MSYTRGFTLIEVAISLFVFGILLIILQSILHVTPFLKSATNQEVALSIARGELETLRNNGYASLPSTGSFSDTLLSTIPKGQGLLTVTTFNSQTKLVTVKVQWQDQAQTASSSVSLSTLVTQNGSLP